MNTRPRSSPSSSQRQLLNLLNTEFGNTTQAHVLVDEFLRQKTYQESFCLKLFGITTQRAGIRWDIRRIAVLMLEHQILKLQPDDLKNFDFILTQLKLKQKPKGNPELVSSLLKEGYSTTNLRKFIPEFRNKLKRLNRVHQKIKGNTTSVAALSDFIELSRQPCKLTLARYLFTPEEIVGEIHRELQVTAGLVDIDLSEPEFIKDEVAHATQLLPDFEAQILNRLCANSKIYWVSDATSSKINSLVEYPTTTVVLVIKLPGSDIEFEIKRAGRRGETSLNIVYARNGYMVAPSHRLDGGCMQWLLRYEDHTASRFGLVYRLVHGADAPIANYISRATIYSIPCRDGEVQMLDYFTEPEFFGPRYRQMRAAMNDSIRAFSSEGTATLPGFPGELGLTGQFIGQVGPAQAILSGTTSYRLDKLAGYLSPGGPERYFKDGLNVPYSSDDARRFTDTILEEVLGVYCPPQVKYRSHDQYLKAAFQVDENRTRANRVYLSLIPQIAKFWGTLLAVRGCTRGESFVGRNVGLKSYWDQGEWKVKIIFMDHDAMAFPGDDEPVFYADSSIPTMAIDERYIWGYKEEQFNTSEIYYLQRIYNVGAKAGDGNALDAEARSLFETSLHAAYRKTRQALLSNQRLRSLFHDTFLERLLDWDTVVGGYLRLNNHKSVNAKWKKDTNALLAAKGYRKGACNALIATIEKNRPFLERYSFLFQLDNNKPA